jgi:hypothetical protein
MSGSATMHTYLIHDVLYEYVHSVLINQYRYLLYNQMDIHEYQTAIETGLREAMDYGT